jgi:hypothetical protein
VPVTYHADIDVVSGTDWTIAGTLYDATGKLLDVTNCALAWVLLDPDGNPVLPTDLNITISKTDPVNGAIQITVPMQYTYLRPGRYTDALQVTEGTSTDVFWMGQLRCAANPLNVFNNIVEQPVPPPAPTSSYEEALVVVPQWWWTVPNAAAPYYPYYPYYGGWW